MRKREREISARTYDRVKFGIVPKLLLGILIPLFVVLIIMGVFLGIQGSRTINDVMSAELDAGTKGAASQVDGFFERYYGITECLAATQIVRDTVAEDIEGGIANDTLYNSLLETLELIQGDNQEDIAYIWICKFKTGEVLQNDGQIYSPADLDYTTRDWYTLVMNKQDSVATSAYISVNTGDMMVTVASPVFVNGQIQGIVGIDLNMDNLNQMLSTVKVGNTGYITLYDSNGQILFHPDSSLINTNAADANYSSNMLNAIEGKEEHSAMLYTRSGTTYYGSTTTIDSIGYTMLGVMPEAEYVSHTNAILRILVVGIVVCAVLLSAICVFIALSITRPLKRLDAAVGKLADGELDVQVETHGGDEVAKLGGNVARIVERLREYIDYIDEISDVLLQIGKGNLAFALHQDYVGEFSKIKDALLHIQGTLTETMTSIAQSADQVNAGAEQIASGAQALAQGATEQASSVQELSSAVQELSSQATDEANKAVEAGEFLMRIRGEVEKSNEQMELMRKAMADISVQSSAIRGIIKTIDDIAFQTNILALNAAVEAARAGSAGKGFAVVADEVRNLAGKSAEAAKKTNELIENSVHAVKHGEELTQTTAESLSVVADGTNQIVETIHNVAEAYRAQADRLTEISSGVDQISNVVQTNSATAEESAAASQELSGQASMMRQQVSQFKFDGSASYSSPMSDSLPQQDDFNDINKY